MAFVAGFPMYDWPEVRSEINELWEAVAQNLILQGVAAPKSLWRPENLEELWGHPELLVGQMCGLPFVEHYQSKVSVLGTLTHDLLVSREDTNTDTDLLPGSYYSVLVAHRDNPAKSLTDFSDQRAAINEVGSQSGDAALNQAAQEQGMSFFEVVASGTHRESIKLLAAGQVDVAAIDVVSWHLALDHEPAVQELRVFGATTPTPGLPLVVANQQAHLREEIIQAISKAVKELTPEIKSALHLKGFLARQSSQYLDNF